MSSEPAVQSGGSAAVSGSALLEFERPLASMKQAIDELQRQGGAAGSDVGKQLRQHQSKFKSKLKRLYQNLTPWETVLVARHSHRPLSPDYLRMIFRDFAELHGDRNFGDDKAMITGFARIGGHRVMFIGHNKGKDVRERLACNFGCAHPEGYRKSLLKMRLAEKYGLPVVCLIDTQGAYPGIGAEERGISHAIAVNLMEMSRLRTPIVCAVIGEGGSGGALGIGVGDRVAMMQHATYSVISPEGCAAILWKTSDHRKHAAEALRLTAPDLRKNDLIDVIIPEPVGGAHRDPETAAKSLEKFIVGSLDDLKRLTVDAVLRQRQHRIRNIGSFFESPSEAKKPAPRRRSATRRATPRSTRLGTRATKREQITS